MGLAVFYLPDLAGPDLVLDGAEGRHASVVRRIGPGERIRLTDGRGSFAEGPVTAASKAGLTMAVEHRGQVEQASPRLVVVQALPKGERAELAVEMLTEVGVDLIVPWNAERSQFRSNPERVAKTLTKWQAWAFEASKQSRRSWFCEVAPIASTADVAQLVADASCAVILHEEATTPIASLPLPDHRRHRHRRRPGRRHSPHRTRSLQSRAGPPRRHSPPHLHRRSRRGRSPLVRLPLAYLT